MTSVNTRLPPNADGRAGDDPAQRLLAEVAQLRTKAAGRDRALLRLGAVLMVAGPVLGAFGYLRSSQTNSPLHQNDATIIAIVGLTVAVVGTALFLRYSLGEFLRFWMARLIAEQRPRVPVPPKRAPAPKPAAPNSLATAPPPPPAPPPSSAFTRHQETP